MTATSPTSDDSLDTGLTGPSGSSDVQTTTKIDSMHDRPLPGLSPRELLALPAAFPFDPIVSAAFGISRSSAYRALAAGQLPITPLRLGRRLIVRRADLLNALGITDEAEGRPTQR